MLRSVGLWIRVENYIGDVVTLVKKHIESVQTLLRVSERMIQWRANNPANLTPKFSRRSSRNSTGWQTGANLLHGSIEKTGEGRGNRHLYRKPSQGAGSGSQRGENMHEQSECPDNVLALSVDSIHVPMNAEVATSHSFPNPWRCSESYRKVRLVKINSLAGCHGPW